MELLLTLAHFRVLNLHVFQLANDLLEEHDVHFLGLLLQFELLLLAYCLSVSGGSRVCRTSKGRSLSTKTASASAAGSRRVL